MRIGAHVDFDDPLAAAKARNADVVQFFLADPQGWATPVERPDATVIRDSETEVFIHAPYVINVATLNNRIRIPSRKLMVAHLKAARTVGARGLIVHGGHVNKGDDIDAGFTNWRKALQYAQEQGELGADGVPVLIENTAGGDNACARRFDALARLWDAVGEFRVGFVLDTCHAHAGGEDLVGIVDRVKAITGRIDLVHANGSRDEFDSGRDRHDNLNSKDAPGSIDPELVATAVRAAGAPAVVETPGGSDGQSADIEFLRKRLG